MLAAQTIQTDHQNFMEKYFLNGKGVCTRRHSTNSIQINMYTFLFESMEWNTKNYIDDS